ncbi:MAG: hypothetical protein AB7U61_10290 [Methylocystis sp.]
MRGIALSILAAAFIVGTVIEFTWGQLEQRMILKGDAQAFGIAILLAALTCIAMGV